MYVVTTPPSFKKIHWRKRENIYCQFCVLCSCWRHKNRKTLMFSFISWNKFFADQLETWSTASCALLCCPFGTFSDKVVSSTYFHIPKSALGVTRSLIMSKKSQGPHLVPWGTLAGTAPHSDKQSRLSFTLWDRSDRKSRIQLTILLGTSTSLSLAARVPWSMKSKALR